MNQRIYLPVILFLFSFGYLSGQDYNQDSLSILKKEGKLKGNIQYFNKKSGEDSSLKISPPDPTVKNVTNCNCWVPRDSTFQVVKFNGSGANGGPGISPDYRNDDWSTASKALPFSFCFYGTTINQIFINNNGNISFGSAYSTFTSNPFPDASFSMVAPFWGDVDTRGSGSGIVYYKLSSKYLIVQWDSVGYYNSYYDKVNTFQLIISNGTDSIIPDGNNVNFCYKDMQWTTGEASISPPCETGGNGFGGCPATVGVNKGDGINYLQFGQFDKAGNAFDGSFGNADGIDWLDNQSINFSTCNSSNFPPVVNGLSICDTVQLCQGDTVNISVSFLSPEENQVTVASVTSPGVNGFSIVSNTSGNAAFISTGFIATQNDLGFNTITYSGTDDGSPPQTTSFTIVIHVDSSTAVLDNAGPFCANDSLQTLNSFFSGGTWDGPGISDTVLGVFNPATAGIGNHVISYLTSEPGCNGNPLMGSIVITVLDFPDPSLSTSDTSFCEGDSITIYSQPADYYLWSNGDSTSSITISSSGNYFLLLSDSTGCSSSSDTISIMEDPLPALPIISQAGTILTSSSMAGNQWLLNGVIITGAINQGFDATLEGNYSVLVTDSNGCSTESLPYYFFPDNINENKPGIKVHCYPNPNKGSFFIVPDGEPGIIRLEIYGLLGKKIFEKKISERRDEIDLRQCPDGIYFYRIKSEKESSSGKLIIVK